MLSLIVIKRSDRRTTGNKKRVSFRFFLKREMVFLWSRHVERYVAMIKATLELEQNDALQRSTHSRRFLSLSLSYWGYINYLRYNTG